MSSLLRPALRTLYLTTALALSVSAALDAPVTPHSQVIRFAGTGRADASEIRLASGRTARVTVAALSETLSRDRRSGSFHIIAEHGTIPADDAAIVRRLLVIPQENQGSLSLVFETPDPAIRQSVMDAADFLTGVVSSRWLPRSVIRIRALEPGRNRAYATGLGGDASIHLQPGVVDIPTAIHEIAHHIEGDHRWVLELSKRFIARRARGGAPESLRDLTGEDYESHEIALRANWTTRGGHHYTGKFYGPSLRDAHATEVISMGLERLYREPDTFYRDDADYFLFLLLVLQSG